MIALWAVAAAAAAYQIVAIVACLKQILRKEPQSNFAPPVSILKPIRGRDDRLPEAIGSHATLDYPEYEVLFGVQNPSDPAIPDIERLAGRHANIRLVHCTRIAPNGKAAVLSELSEHARHPIILLNDSDIVVEPDYLRRVVAPLEDPRVGLVTCLYRATGDSFPARFEALGIITDFAPSVLVAPLFGVNEFGLGSTIVLRAVDLERMGGFESVAEYLADDYQIGKNISKLGLRGHLSTLVVETSLGRSTWSGIWNHQVRWARTIRVSRGAYIGLPVTNATLWSLVLALAGAWTAATVLMALRFTMALIAGKGVLRANAPWWLIPARDLWGFAVWVAGIRGDTVVWRDRKLRLSPDGRIKVGDGG